MNWETTGSVRTLEWDGIGSETLGCKIGKVAKENGGFEVGEAEMESGGCLENGGWVFNGGEMGMGGGG
jgi:hypothetical protein